MTDDKIILTDEQTISLLPDGDDIHTFRNPNVNIMLGADWTREKILTAIDMHICEVGGVHCRNAGHGLIIWTDSESPLFVATRKDVDWEAFETATSPVDAHSMPVAARC